MLKQVQVDNFQSLGSVKLELGNFTVVEGASDVGKSALIRAIGSLLSNRRGQDFIRHGQKTCIVQLGFDDGVVLWRKDGSTASYITLYNDQKETYTKLGTGVPDEVNAILRTGEIAIGDEKVNLNLHTQFDQPFLVTANPITRARLLGHISGINVLQSAVTYASRQERETKRTQGVRVKDLEQVTESLTSYRYLAGVKTQLDESTGLVERVRDVQSQAGQLEQHLRRLKQATALRDECEATRDTAVVTQTQLEGVLERAEAVRDLDQAVMRLKTAYDAVDSRNQAKTALTVQHAKLLQELNSHSVCPTCKQPVSSWMEVQVG